MGNFQSWWILSLQAHSSAAVESEFKAVQVSWLMHSRIPSRADKGRPHKCWTEYVREDLNVLRLLHNWSRAAQDRVSWRDKIQRLLGHTQHNAGNV